MDEEYKIWLKDLKDKIRTAQLKASIAVNEQLILLYWDIGKSIVEKQSSHSWGAKVIEMMAKDLKRELPDSNGFSRSNLFSMRQFYLFYYKSEIFHESIARNELTELVQQPVGLLSKNSILAKIPWGHHVVILSKCKSNEEAKFYLEQTITNNWSRNILELQIKSGLVSRLGKAQNNFTLTLPKSQSDLAIESLKDPYKFDFLTLEANVQEVELEKKLTQNITQFLLELGKGFAYVGRQYPLQIGTKERKIDLLFYHLKMHCYVIVDLKMGEFEPEFVGKMNYYLSAVDDLLKTEKDQPSIGVILCKSKERFDVEYALRDINKPLGISEFSFNELPTDIQQNFPTVEEIENELKNLNELQND